MYTYIHTDIVAPAPGCGRRPGGGPRRPPAV